jgi:hypothetical protein
VLNSCIEVSDYNEPYSLCQPPSSLPDNPWFNDDKPRGIHTPLHSILLFYTNSYFSYLYYYFLFYLLSILLNPLLY